MAQRDVPLLLAAKDLRNDIPFFGSVGFICGIVQWAGYRYFDKTQWGAELLQEHIAFHSMLLMVMFLWPAKVLVERVGRHRKLPRVDAFVMHVSARAAAFASVAAAVIAGFALAAACFGAFGHAMAFLFFCIYFVAIAEIAANPVLSKNRSRTHGFALVMLIATPLGLSLSP